MKLLVSDYDQTLTVGDINKNIEMISKFVKKNNYFVIATGRNYKSIMNEIKKLEIPYQFLICNDGSIIFDKNNKEIYRNNLGKEKHLLFEYLKKKVANLKIDDGYEYYHGGNRLRRSGDGDLSGRQWQSRDMPGH